jgi:hypothetical protein
MSTINPAQLRNLLQNGKVEILFTKVDGTERRMIATLQEEFFEGEFKGKGAQPVIEADSATISVWDLEKSAWRSFRVESIKSVKIGGFEYNPSKVMLLG